MELLPPITVLAERRLGEEPSTPLARTHAALIAAGVAAQALDAAAAEVAQRIEAAIAGARADGLPAFEPAFAGVYTEATS